MSSDLLTIDRAYESICKSEQIGQCPVLRAFGDLALEYQNTPLLVIHVFRLFTTRPNCRAFLLLRLVYKETDNFGIYRFELLERTEPNSTTFYDPRIRSKSVHRWASAEFFQVGEIILRSSDSRPS